VVSLDAWHHSKKCFRGAFLGLFFGFGFLSQTWGLQHTASANSSFITGSMAIFTPIAAFLIDRRTVSIYQALGILICAHRFGFFLYSMVWKNGNSMWGMRRHCFAP
jgi:hypothetical protein